MKVSNKVTRITMEHLIPGWAELETEKKYGVEKGLRWLFYFCLGVRDGDYIPVAKRTREAWLEWCTVRYNALGKRLSSITAAQLPSATDCFLLFGGAYKLGSPGADGIITTIVHNLSGIAKAMAFEGGGIPANEVKDYNMLHTYNDHEAIIRNEAKDWQKGLAKLFNASLCSPDCLPDEGTVQQEEAANDDGPETPTKKARTSDQNASNAGFLSWIQIPPAPKAKATPKKPPAPPKSKAAR